MSNSNRNIKSFYLTSAKQREEKIGGWKEVNIVYYTFYGFELQKAIRNTAELLGNF